jgi:hypothetical protein
MGNRLLDRQASLLAYLTSSAAIFGEDREAPLDRSLHGIDPALLRLEARFSYEKRLDKIASVFPRTLKIMGSRAEGALRAFVQACPPAEMSRLANGRQFYDFVSARWRDDPPYLPDVMACELARMVAVHGSESTEPGEDEPRWRRAIRRRPGVVLLRCSHDIQSIFDQAVENPSPPKRDTRLAVVIPPGASQSRIVEVAPAVFDLLATLDDWADASAIDGRADELIGDLTDHALIEVHA